LFDEVCAELSAKARCEKHSQEGGFRNLDHFLESLVLDKKFRALVIIDEETDDLHAVTKNLGFAVEIIEFSTYANQKKGNAFTDSNHSSLMLKRWMSKRMTPRLFRSGDNVIPLALTRL
jgi:hypothetical protein